jgi:hypothetical protein
MARELDPPRVSLPAPAAPERSYPSPAEPTPPPVGRAEAYRQIARVVPGGLRLLRTSDGPAVLLVDLNGDKQWECFAVAASTSGLAAEDLRRLSDPSRLFEDDAAPVEFQLVLFAGSGGVLEVRRVLPLGRYLVFDALRGQPLKLRQALPFLVTVGFLTPEGKKAELLVFDDETGNARYRRSLTESLSSSASIADIDGDGTQDLVLSERAMEEGTGYETFLTWCRWDGRVFGEYRTINVVRNLNGFLAGVREQILGGRIDEFLSRAVLPLVLERLRGRGLEPEAIVLATIGLEPTELAKLPEVREIVLPPILENPFTSPDDIGAYFVLSFRMVDSAGSSFIANTRVYLLHNPFGVRQFALAPPLD